MTDQPLKGLAKTKVENPDKFHEIQTKGTEAARDKRLDKGIQDLKDRFPSVPDLGCKTGSDEPKKEEPKT